VVEFVGLASFVVLVCLVGDQASRADHGGVATKVMVVVVVLIVVAVMLFMMNRSRTSDVSLVGRVVHSLAVHRTRHFIGVSDGNL
jgi:glycerol uptake facilitator-like aquaporin